MPFRGYSVFWYHVAWIIDSQGLETLMDSDGEVDGDEVWEDYEERLRKDQNALRELLYAEATVQTEDAKINPTIAVFKKLDSDTKRLEYLQFDFETFTKNATNFPIVRVFNCCEGSLSFRTRRRDKIAQVDILLRKLPLRFYDEKDDHSDEYCLELYVNKDLANPGKLQQEFSMFLASGKHIIEFLFDSIWPHLDESDHEFNEIIRKQLEERIQKTTDKSFA